MLLAGACADLTGGAGHAATRADAGPAQVSARAGLWVVQVTPAASGAFDRPGLQRLRAYGINAIALDIQSLGSSERAVRTYESVRSFARGARMTLVPVFPTGKSYRSPLLWHALAGCKTGGGVLCAARAPSLAAARKLAGVADPVRPLVVFYSDGPSAVRSLITLRAVKRRIVVIAPLYKSFNRVHWSTAVAQAEASSAVELGVAPQVGLGATSTEEFGGSLTGKKVAAAAPTTAVPSAPRDTTPPSAPVVAVTDYTPYTVTIAWQPSTDGVGISSYNVYVDGKVVKANAASPVTLEALTCGTHYAIGVDAVDAAGNRSPASTVDGVPRPCGGGGGDSPPLDTVAPSAPAGLATSGVSPTSITLSWGTSSDNVKVAGYRVYLNGTQVTTTSGTSYTFAGLTCGSTYSLSVAAYDAAANLSAPGALSRQTLACAGDTTAPSPPAALSTISVTQTAVTLSWSASSDNIGVTGYRLFRDGTQVDTAAGTSYAFGGLTCGTSYTLGVAAVDAGGNVSGTATRATTTTACSDSTAPSTPSALSTTAAGQTSVTLSWTASNDNVGVAGYRLYRNGTQVGTSVATNYLFSGLTCGTSYTLGVAAVDAAGNVSGTATQSVVTSACSGGSGTANVYVATSGSDATCVRGDAAKPCSSFNKAFSVASCGDSVSVAAGTYAAQTLSTVKSCTSTSPVTFTPAGSVSLTGTLSVNAGYVTFDGSGFNFARTYDVGQNASYVVFKDVSTSHAFIMGSHVTIQGGQIGPNNNCATGWEDGLQIWDNGSVSASYVTVDGVTIHDITDNGNQCAGSANSGVHTDCVQLLGPNNVTIRNSVFYNCATSAIMARPYTTPLNNITIENNMMGPIVTPGASINVGNSSDSCTNVVVRYNTAMTNPSLVCGAGGSGNIATGNIFDGYFAQAGFANSYNVTRNTNAIGTGSKRCTPTFGTASTTTGDYHLASSDTCAKNAGNPSNYPPTDRDGHARPAGAAPDAGAHEVG